MTEVILPVMDQAGGDVTLTRWLKHEGDAIRVGDALCEIETSKASVEITAEAAGTLRRVLVAEGAALPALTVLALIGDPAETLPAVDPFYRVTGSQPAQSPPAANPLERGTSGAASLSNGRPATRSAGGKSASPRARKLAGQYGVDLSAIAGTGPDGRVVEEDVRRALEGRL
jgi:pyruvate dehydrogenase E2 component (dihydrolipoamide acetyltransferase)